MSDIATPNFHAGKAIITAQGERIAELQSLLASTQEENLRLREALEEAKAAIADVIGTDSALEMILFGDFPDAKTITITAPLGAFRRARSLSQNGEGER